MIATKITHTRLALSELAGSIPEDAWQLVKRVQDELASAADMAAQLESTLTVPNDAPRLLFPLRPQYEPYPRNPFKPCLKDLSEHNASSAPRLRLIPGKKIQ